MIELLFLLLPVAAAYGWFMGRNSVRAEQRREQEQFSQKYVTGINLLLSDQSDKAVDLFVDILDVDSETLDTHWALGKLFRRRGEVERAIRIHQNLISRPSLSGHDRHLALFELGEDYLSAGLYDRAEKMFQDLQQQNTFRNDSLYNLLTIYEATHEWHKAIKTALKIARSDKRVEATIAQFYCELADVQEDADAAIKYYQKALKHDRRCVRASLALSRWWMGQERYQQALTHLLKIKEQDADFLAEALPLIRDSYLALGERANLVSYLHECVERYPSASAVVMLAELIAEENNLEQAEAFMTRALAENPTTRGFHKLIDLHIRTADKGKARDSLLMLRNMVAERLKRSARYHCRHCGFSGQTLYWHCPSCKSWATIKPTLGLDGE